MGKEFDLETLEKKFATLEYQWNPLYQIEDAFEDRLSDNQDTWVYKSPALIQKGTDTL